MIDADGVFRIEFTVPESAIDGNGHVNNVVYIQWMQDVAIQHADAPGGSEAASAIGCAWVARSHRIDYLSPAFAGDLVEGVTWVVNMHRVRSTRRYRFTRKSDGKVLARGETEWVFVSASDWKPRGIPESVSKCFKMQGDIEPNGCGTKAG